MSPKNKSEEEVIVKIVTMSEMPGEHSSMSEDVWWLYRDPFSLLGYEVDTKLVLDPIRHYCHSRPYWVEQETPQLKESEHV